MARFKICLLLGTIAYGIAWLLLRKEPAPVCTLVLVHLGRGIAAGGKVVRQSEQIIIFFEQFRLFNKKERVFLITDPTFIFTPDQQRKLQIARVHMLHSTSFAQAPLHVKWLKESPLANKTTRENFWRYTTERFFLLAYTAKQFGLSNVIHMVRGAVWTQIP